MLRLVDKRRRQGGDPWRRPMVRNWLYALALLGAGISNGWADEGVRGIWQGTYTCNQSPEGTLTLKIEDFAKGRFSGEFSFSVGVAQGSYRIAGSVDSSGGFRLQPKAWIHRPKGFDALAMRGRVATGGTHIGGTFPRCKTGGFSMALTERLPLPQEDKAIDVDPQQDQAVDASQQDQAQPAPVSKEDQDKAWADGIRARIAELVQAGDDNWEPWGNIKNEIRSNAPDSATAHGLMDELEEGRNQIQAHAWLAEWASTVTQSPDDELQHALNGLSHANGAQWPEQVVAGIREAMRGRVAAALRPLFSEVASQVPTLTATLDSIIRVRAALEPLWYSRNSVIEAYGTMDPEGILEPVWIRIAEIEKDPRVAEELGAAFAQARGLTNPRWETEQVVNRVFGPEPPASHLAPMIESARELANIAAIQVADESSDVADPLEPSAWNIAAFVYTRAIAINASVAVREKQCAAGQYSDPIGALECLPFLSTGQLLGGLQARVARVAKRGCTVEKPGTEFRCSFLQHIDFVSAAGGPLAPDLTDRLVGDYFPDGYRGEVNEARFHRAGADGKERWVVTWESRPVAVSGDAGHRPVSCPYGQYDAGGFCFPFNAFGRW